MHPNPNGLKFGIVSSRSTGEEVAQVAFDNYVVTVGEMIQHLAVADAPILSVVWTIEPSTNVADYAVSVNNAVLTYLPAAALMTNPLTFAYGDAGNSQVVVTAEITTTLGTGTASNSFTVTSPTIGNIEVTMGNPEIFVNQMGETMFQLTAPGGGVVIEATVNGTQAAIGTIAFFQLVKNARTLNDSVTGQQYLSPTGEFILDVGGQVGEAPSYLYQGVSETLTPNQPTQFYITDSPGTSLPNPPGTLLIYSVGEDDPGDAEMYQSYLMFQSSTPGSIWVPVALVNWSWSSYTEAEDGSWSPAQNNLVLNDGGGTTYTFPTWQANTTASTWQGGPGPLAATEAP
jgi:hypothetical protein